MASWVQLTEGCVRAGCSQNQLYRFAALRRVRSRRGPNGRVEFAVADLDRIARERGIEPKVDVRAPRTHTLET